MSISTAPRRLAIAFFYDEHGIVDEYMIHLLNSLKPFVEKTIFVVNGPLSKDAEIKLEKTVETLIARENTGFDVWAYKAAIEHVGYEALAEYDEVLLLNHTFYGPLYPWSEMFSEMEKRDCDFWGITAHDAVTPNPFTQEGTLPFHINSHFIAVRKTMLSSQVFRNYWRDMPKIESYTDSVLKHESRFTDFFSNLGYRYSVYMDNDAEVYGNEYPLLFAVDRVIERRCPILKRRSFFHPTRDIEAMGVDLPRALFLLSKTSNYDRGMIWRNAVRTVPLRTLSNNAALLSILSDETTAPDTHEKIAVCAHIADLSKLPTLLAATANIPVGYDFIATTDTAEKQTTIKAAIEALEGVSHSEVRVAESTNGGDISALLITCRDLIVDGKYDLVCRLNTNTAGKPGESRSYLAERHQLDNLLASKGYTKNLIDLFSKQPWAGIVMPPVMHIAFPNLGHGWSGAHEEAKRWADKLGLRVTLEDKTPVSSYGGMFWFRPKALKALTRREWAWKDFDDKGAAKTAIERLIAYAAQEESFATHHVMSTRSASLNYSMLEFKADAVLSQMPQTWFIGVMQHLDALVQRPQKGYGLKSALKSSLHFRFPATYRFMSRVARRTGLRR